MKLSETLWAAALFRHAIRPSQPDNGNGDDPAGCIYLIAIVIALALILGMLA